MIDPVSRRDAFRLAAGLAAGAARWSIRRPIRTAPALLKLGEKHGVKFLTAMQCNYIARPSGQALWEGSPLREVLKLCGKLVNPRRLHYWGFHNDKPEQVFRSEWPVWCSAAYWSLVLKDVRSGKYELRVRTVDKNGLRPANRSRGRTRGQARTESRASRSK